MSAKPKRPGARRAAAKEQVTMAQPDDGAARIAAARREVEAILRTAAPNFALGEGPLNRLAIYLSNAPWQDWPAKERGFPKVEKRLARLEKMTGDLLREIDHAQSGKDVLRIPGGGAWLILRMNAAVQPVRDLSIQLRREREGLPSGKGAEAWKNWAHTFYDLAVQTWLEGGEPFWRGERRNFGVHPRGKATQAVKGLLAKAMKERPRRKPPSADTISELLTTLPDPLPWVEENGRDLEAYANKEWDHNGFYRINLKKSNAKQKHSENIEKKKRGRPRGK